MSHLHDPDSGVEVNYFAENDSERTAHLLESGIEHALQAVQDLKIEKQRRKANGLYTLNFQHRIDRYRDDIELWERKLPIIQRMPLKLGKVLASSGTTLADNRVSNWAFIELDPTVFQNDPSNFVNTTQRVDESGASPGQLREALCFFLPKGVVVYEYDGLRPGKWYCRIGRTPYWVVGGLCNGTPAYCNWRGKNDTRYKEVVAKGGITEEWVIISQMGRRQGNFCNLGDTGSGILDSYGLLCGLLYGTARPLCGQNSAQVAGLCSSMPDICKSVENIVGPGAVLGVPEPD